MLTIYVVSDATGNTAERMARAALSQFGDAPVRLVRRGGILTEQQVRDVIEEAASVDSILLHTLVSDELRRLMVSESSAHGVDSLDGIGAMLNRIATHLKITPREMPGLFQQLTEARTREIETVAFAFRHDDGLNADELDHAEVVLVGVSRSMKTPTMLYLAYRKLFAANVPLVMETELPEGLLAVPPDRVFCLMMNAAQLRTLRRVRTAGDRIPSEPYVSLDYIQKELAFSRRLCQTHGWRTVDVTGKSVEEVSREIIALLPRESTEQTS